MSVTLVYTSTTKNYRGCDKYKIARWTDNSGENIEMTSQFTPEYTHAFIPQYISRFRSSEHPEKMLCLILTDGVGISFEMAKPGRNGGPDRYKPIDADKWAGYGGLYVPDCLRKDKIGVIITDVYGTITHDLNGVHFSKLIESESEAPPPPMPKKAPIKVMPMLISDNDEFDMDMDYEAMKTQAFLILFTCLICIIGYIINMVNKV